MTAGVAAHRGQRAAGRGAGHEGGGGDEEQRREPRGREVQDVVEPRRGAAEVAVAVVEVADHAVGGVHRLVGGAAGQTGEGEPEGRGDDAVGEVLGEALDRGARDAGGIERLRVAADDSGEPDAAGGEATTLESGGHRRDVLPEAARSCSAPPLVRRLREAPPRLRAGEAAEPAGPFNLRSSVAISAPIQTMGWRMARKTGAG